MTSVSTTKMEMCIRDSAYYEKASAMPGKTGENLLSLVERRLDNVVYRLGFAMTRREARQLVNHAHFTVNGHKVNIPSYLVRVGDVIEVKESSRSSVAFKRLTAEDAPMVNVPKWLERDKNALKGSVVTLSLIHILCPCRHQERLKGSVS